MSAGEQSSKQRLFLALWPDALLRDAVVDMVQELGLKQGRPVPAENLHVTLVFLGSVKAAQRGCIEQAVAGVRHSRFSLILDNLAYVARARMLWLSSSGLPQELTNIVSQLQQGLSACGIAIEKRRFHAHLTLARKVVRAPRLPRITPLQWPVQEIVLVQSRTEKDGAQYQVLRRWPLL